MAHFTFNIAKGRAAGYQQSAVDNSPAGCGISQIILSSTDTDEAIRDCETVSELLALSNTIEVTNTDYARDTYIGSSSVLVDTTNDWVRNTTSNPYWSHISPGDAWTHIVWAYDPDGTNTDASMIPLACAGFTSPIIPNGGDIGIDTNPSNTFYISS